jgi:hypothetical protein
MLNFLKKCFFNLKNKSKGNIECLRIILFIEMKNEKNDWLIN